MQQTADGSRGTVGIGLFDGVGTLLDESAGTSDSELVAGSLATDVYLLVTGFSGAQNTYTLTSSYTCP